MIVEMTEAEALVDSGGGEKCPRVQLWTLSLREGVGTGRGRRR